jgi:hypothetical protein
LYANGCSFRYNGGRPDCHTTSRTHRIKVDHAMMTTLKRSLVGQPLETAAQHEQRLTKHIALAVFSSDALSSVVSVSEAILIALLAAQQQARGYATPILVEITLLLIPFAFS